MLLSHARMLSRGCGCRSGTTLGLRLCLSEGSTQQPCLCAVLCHQLSDTLVVLHILFEKGVLQLHILVQTCIHLGERIRQLLVLSNWLAKQRADKPATAWPRHRGLELPLQLGCPTCEKDVI